MRMNREAVSDSVGFGMKAVVTVMSNLDLGIALAADNFVAAALFGLFLNRNTVLFWNY